MKALELKLRQVFYDSNVKYLMEKYKKPEEYAQLILPAGFKDDYEKAVQLKKMVLTYNGGLAYIDTKKEKYFTFGAFVHTIQTSESNDRLNRHFDKPVIDYCSEKLFADYDVSNSAIRRWLVEIVTGIETQKQTRDDSAHGRIVQNKIAAEKVLREVVTVEKLLAKIVSPSFIK